MKDLSMEQITQQYFDVLKKKALPDNVQFAVEFDSSAADKLSISKVRSVNGN